MIRRYKYGRDYTEWKEMLDMDRTQLEEKRKELEAVLQATWDDYDEAIGAQEKSEMMEQIKDVKRLIGVIQEELSRRAGAR